ncbi:AAA family ATPase [Streptomyces sp. NPDC001999]
MTWSPYYTGDGVPRDVELAPPPPWRTFPRHAMAQEFKPPAGLVESVNAALHLRRPLLVTGPAGSGKSTVIEQVASELKLGTVLRWHITSRSTLNEALYRYDALGRIHAQRLGQAGGVDDIAPFMQLGPLGTALLPSNHPRALLIDEVDKSDLDLPSDLLDVLERGEYEVPELARYQDDIVPIRQWGSDEQHAIVRGRIRCTQFPFIVMTSNGERDFPAAFLRRCIRYTMTPPTIPLLRQMILAHLQIDIDDSGPVRGLVEEFVARLESGESLAIDQLLNAIYVMSGNAAPDGVGQQEVAALLMRELSRA